jgi:hypothetical protein
VGRVIETDRPTFRWRRLAGAASYSVTVADDRLNEIATSESLTGQEWRITRPLEYGGVYTWQVTAIKDGREVSLPFHRLPQPGSRSSTVRRLKS